MSFKPIDIQVNISQMNHVARSQQQERAQPLHDQAAHAAHIKKEGDERQHIVEPKGQTSNDESTVKWRKDGNQQQKHKDSQGSQHHQTEKNKRIQMRILECDSEDKGNIIDTMK